MLLILTDEVITGSDSNSDSSDGSVNKGIAVLTAVIGTSEEGLPNLSDSGFGSSINAVLISETELIVGGSDGFDLSTVGTISDPGFESGI